MSGGTGLYKKRLQNAPGWSPSCPRQERYCLGVRLDRQRFHLLVSGGILWEARTERERSDQIVMFRQCDCLVRRQTSLEEAR